MLISTSAGISAAEVFDGPSQGLDGEMLSKLIATASESLDSDLATAKDCIQRAADLLQGFRRERLQSTARQTPERTLEFHEPNRRQPDFSQVNLNLTIRFGPFCVHPRSRELFADGQPVDIGSRAFDLLIVLLEACGALVPKQRIMQRLWPTTVVEECNLRQQMALLRKALGSFRDVIKTVPGRGYVFAADTETVNTPAFRCVILD